MTPKIIHICYKDLDTLHKYSHKWSQLNPGWKLYLYDDKLCDDFLKREYTKTHSNIFNSIPHGPIKADFFRACVLYKYGGLYVDADIEPFQPLETYVDNREHLVTCLSFMPNCYNPHFILVNSNNDVIKKCIDDYLFYYKNNVPYSYWSWSIVPMFNRHLDMGIHNNRPGFYYYKNKTYKFLKEGKDNEDGDGRQYCYYDGKRILSNRYISYQNHGFVNNLFTNAYEFLYGIFRKP
jgi:Glycosyltransferase sugar-binding region containing DXD motif